MVDDKLTNLLMRQYETYPRSQVQDMLKLIYQNEFGCGHMISDATQCLTMINEEAETLSQAAASGDPVEYIGNGLCRLHLRVLRQSTLSPETLNSFFMLTANTPMGSAEGYEQKAAALINLCETGTLPFDAAEVSKMLTENRDAGYPPFRHSEEFRAAYSPAYRVVNKAFCDFLPLFYRIDELSEREKRITLAIDGVCASGKSTLAALLKSVYSCNLFSMDDFFLQSFQRTQARFDEPGGNVDYERFGKEVIEPLQSGNPFTYQIFDCQIMELFELVDVTPNRLNVIEGVYSMRPEFIDTYDIKVFLTLDEVAQQRRLLERNPGMYDKFINEWIPMENEYFDFFSLSAKCDFVFNTELFEE